MLRDSGTDSTAPTSSGLPSLAQAGNLANRLTPDLALASYMASTGAMDQVLDIDSHAMGVNVGKMYQCHCGGSESIYALRLKLV